MKFKIDVDKFIKAVKPSSDIALKNVTKNDLKEPFKYAGMVTIKASTDDLLVKAHGGSASIVITINKEDGYIPDVSGTVTVKAVEILEGLKSFQLADKLIVSNDADQMIVSLESDEEIFMKLPTLPYIIELPSMPKKSVQKCLVDRACFVKGMQTVAYAMAKEKIMSSYMCMLFESGDNRMSLTAGSGGRFARLAINSESHQMSDEDTKIIIPKTNISNIIRIFKNSDHPVMQVRTVEEDYRKIIPEQVVLENGNITIQLYGTEKFTKYPDITSTINHNYSYCISTRMRDWKSVSEAIKATRHFHESQIHNTDVIADLIRGHFVVRPRAEMKVSRKVDFEFGAYEADHATDKNHKPWFRCHSEYLMEMVQKGEKYETVIISFDDQAKLDEIPKDKPKQMKPVLITFPKKTNKDGTTEKYSVLFTVSTK